MAKPGRWPIVPAANSGLSWIATAKSGRGKRLSSPARIMARAPRTRSSAGCPIMTSVPRQRSLPRASKVAAPTQRRHVDVVSAGVHDRHRRAALVLRGDLAGVAKPGLLLDRKPVELRAQQHRRTAAIAEHTDHAGPAHLLGDLEAERAQLRRHLRGGLLLLQRQLRVAVQLLIERVQRRVQLVEPGERFRLRTSRPPRHGREQRCDEDDAGRPRGRQVGHGGRRIGATALTWLPVLAPRSAASPPRQRVGHRHTASHSRSRNLSARARRIDATLQRATWHRSRCAFSRGSRERGGSNRGIGPAVSRRECRSSGTRDRARGSEVESAKTIPPVGTWHAVVARVVAPVATLKEEQDACCHDLLCQSVRDARRVCLRGTRGPGHRYRSCRS